MVPIRHPNSHITRNSVPDHILQSFRRPSTATRALTIALTTDPPYSSHLRLSQHPRSSDPRPTAAISDHPHLSPALNCVKHPYVNIRRHPPLCIQPRCFQRVLSPRQRDHKLVHLRPPHPRSMFNANLRSASSPSSGPIFDWSFHVGWIRHSRSYSAALTLSVLTS
jgi:hypothetical protein